MRQCTFQMVEFVLDKIMIAKVASHSSLLRTFGFSTMIHISHQSFENLQLLRYFQNVWKDRF
jgi:hypothetical protein